jgi:tRNA (guanine-N7-)-methyltransferase
MRVPPTAMSIETESTTERPNLFPYFRTLAEVPVDGALTSVFDTVRPVQLDIGCGRGLFLVNSAERSPEVNWLGLELDYTEGRRTARRLEKRRLENARVVGGDAREFLQTRLPPGCISIAHVYFPDPWWKRKHKKRRLFNDQFADLLAQVVMAGGEVHSWTDVEDYYTVISGLMNHHPSFEPLPLPDLAAPSHDMDYLTSFHRRRSQSGAPPFRGRWGRRA